MIHIMYALIACVYVNMHIDLKYVYARLGLDYCFTSVIIVIMIFIIFMAIFYACIIGRILISIFLQATITSIATACEFLSLFLVW